MRFYKESLFPLLQFPVRFLSMFRAEILVNQLLFAIAIHYQPLPLLLPAIASHCHSRDFGLRDCPHCRSAASPSMAYLQTPVPPRQFRFWTLTMQVPGEVITRILYVDCEGDIRMTDPFHALHMPYHQQQPGVEGRTLSRPGPVPPTVDDRPSTSTRGVRLLTMQAESAPRNPIGRTLPHQSEDGVPASL